MSDENKTTLTDQQRRERMEREKAEQLERERRERDRRTSQTTIVAAGGPPEKSQEAILEFARQELSENEIPDDADPLRREWLHGYRYAFAYLIHWIEFPEGGEI